MLPGTVCWHSSKNQKSPSGIQKKILHKPGKNKLTQKAKVVSVK